MSNSKTYVLDTWKNKALMIEVKQNDSDRTIVFSLKAGGSPIDLTGKSIQYYVEKTDGTVVYNSGYIIDAVNGTAGCKLTAQSLSVLGTQKLEVSIIGPGGKETSFTIYLIVTAGINQDGAIQSSSEFGALVQAMSDWTDIKSDITDGGLDRIKATGKFVTTMNSWIGLLNTLYTLDNATRFYILPKDHVTTGVGGCLKIFGDAYQDGQDYRDLGLYFHANQNGDTGYYGNGVNWINVKVLDNGVYAGKHPDLGFSFQDGAVVAGRITCFANTRPVWVFGSQKPTILNTALIAEFQGSVGITKGNALRLMTADDTKGHAISDDTDDTLKFSLYNGEKTYINGVQTENKTQTYTEFKNAVRKTARLNVTTDISTFDVSAYSTVVIAQPNTNTITSITGSDGQDITILCTVGAKSTFQHNTNMKLQGGVNYTMGYNHTLTLRNIGGVWYEMCRSANA